MSPILGIVLRLLPFVILGLIFTFLQIEAKRRGGSIWSDVGARGWVVAYLATFAAMLLGNTIALGLETSSNVPPDWTTFHVEAPILVGLAVVVFLVARSQFLKSLPMKTTGPY